MKISSSKLNLMMSRMLTLAAAARRKPLDEGHLETAGHVDDFDDLEGTPDDDPVCVGCDPLLLEPLNHAVVVHIDGGDGLLLARAIEFELELAGHDKEVAPETAGAGGGGHGRSTEYAFLVEDESPGRGHLGDPDVHLRIHFDMDAVRLQDKLELAAELEQVEHLDVAGKVEDKVQGWIAHSAVQIRQIRTGW